MLARTAHLDNQMLLRKSTWNGIAKTAFKENAQEQSNQIARGQRGHQTIKKKSKLKSKFKVMII